MQTEKTNISGFSLWHCLGLLLFVFFIAQAIPANAKTETIDKAALFPLNTGAAVGPQNQTTKPAEEDAEKSWFLSFLESKLSAPNRQIQITGLQGVLSSKASIDLITIADNSGIWLRLYNVKLDWNRLSLLRGRISINNLSADKIEILRKPLPNPQSVKLEAKSSFSFSLPDLPLGLHVDALKVRQLLLGQPLIGQAAALSIEGNLLLDGDQLKANLTAKRLDGAGGNIDLAVSYDDKAQNLKLDTKFDEPENGILANLLQLEDGPPLHFTVSGGGEAGAWNILMHMEAAARPVLNAQLNLQPIQNAADLATSGGQNGDRKMFNFVVSGPIASVLPPVYRPFFGEKTALNVHGAFKQAGGIRVDKFSAESDAVDLIAQGETTADGFLRRLRVDGVVGRGAGKTGYRSNPAFQGGSIVLPVKGGTIAVDLLRLNIRYGLPETENWSGTLQMNNFQSKTESIKRLNLTMGGLAENLDDVATRHISANVKGGLFGILVKGNEKQNAEIPQMDLALSADWQAGQALLLHNAELKGGGLTLSVQGKVENQQFAGTTRLAAADIADFAEIFGQKWAGSVNLGVAGNAAFSGGVFDLTFSGGSHGLKTDNPAINPLLRSDITISGGLARDTTGMTARNLRIANGQFGFSANGDLHNSGANLDFSANLADLALLRPFLDKKLTDAGKTEIKIPQTGGVLTVKGALRGHNNIIALAAQANIAKGVWNGRPVQNLRLRLNGIADNSSPVEHFRSATLHGQGQVGADALNLDAALHQNGEKLRLDSVNLHYGQTELYGFLQNIEACCWNGNIVLHTADIAPLAALAFTEGQGKADIAIALKAEAASKIGTALQQNISFDGQIDGLSIARPFAGKTADKLLMVDHLAVNGWAKNIFALPQIQGIIEGQGLYWQSYGIKTLALNSDASGQASVIKADTVLKDGTHLALGGQISPFPPTGSSNKSTVRSTDKLGDWQFVLDNLTLNDLPVSRAEQMAAKIETSASSHAAKQQKTGKTKINTSTETLPAVKDQLTLQTENSARFIFRNKDLRKVEHLALAIHQDSAPSGFIHLDGALAETLNLNFDAQNLPLMLANIVRPDLGLRGILDGTAHIRGSQTKPIADFDIKLQDVAAKNTLQQGITPLNLSLKGQTENNILTLDALLVPSAAATQDLQLRIQGQVILNEKKLDLTADANAVPLSLLNGIIRNSVLAEQNLSGTLNAHAVIGGSFTDPKVQFDALIHRFSAAPLVFAKIMPLEVKARGTADKHVLQLEEFSLVGTKNLAFNSSGRLAFQSKELDLQLQGSLPLALANGFLEARDTQLGGFLTITEGHIGGSLKAPQMQGKFTVQQGLVLSAPANLRLQPVEISGHLNGTDILLDKMTARSANGGNLVVSGRISADGRAAYPLSLQLKANRFGYNDGSMVAATLDGALTVNGAILQGVNIGGKINIDKAEIHVPDSFGSASLPNFTNKHITRAIAVTQKRAGIVSNKTPNHVAAEKAASAHILPKLNIEITAPNQIYIRGRGLDAEMGGKLQITGRADAIKPNGGFNLIQGTFDMLAQRLVFRQGQVTLAGNFNPELNFVAVSQNENVTVTITVSGTPKNLKITLSSSPVLPQDEILAQLIFKRSLSDLSPIQIAQLVDAAAELAGVTSHSVFGGLRSATGLDRFDVTTDAAGNAAVSLGRYIINKLYLGVETAAGGASRGTVNLDITSHLKAKGSVGSDSNSNVGVFYEKDY